MRRWIRHAWVLGVLVAAPVAAQPDDDAPPVDGDESMSDADADAPWAAGVSAEDRDTARRLLERGNALFLEAKYREALAAYEEAIAAWDHPAIRFNIVRVLINLDRPVEAYDNLEKALAYGPEPLEDTVYREAKNYQRLLEGQIARVEVRCSQNGVTVSINGEELMRCPGSTVVRLRPGTHSVIGKKKNYLTMTEDVVALPGETATIDVRLMTLDDATVVERRWAAWKPWAVVAGGAVVTGVGGLFQRKAKGSFVDYGNAVDEHCMAMEDMVCTVDDLGGFSSLKTRAERENRAAIGLMIAGGAATAAGLTLAVINRARRVRPEAPEAPSRPDVVPEISARGAGVRLIHRF